MNAAALVTASAIFVATYALMISGRVHRALAGLAGAAAMATAGISLRFFPREAVLASLDLDTLWLLFGMMALVGLLRETGFFQYVAIRATKFARGNPLVLFISLGLTTAVASMFLDNVTTLLTVVPVTISVTEILGLPAAPLILMEAIAANIGGTATLVGDPPNILIGSAGNLSFNAFLTHVAPVALVVLGATLALLVLRFRPLLTLRPEHVESVMAMDEKRALSDPKAMGKLLAVLGLVFVLFSLHGLLGLPPGLIALVGAAGSALLLGPSVEGFLRGVEWDLLLFLASLLILTGGLEHSGALGIVGRWVVAGTRGSLVILALILLWLGTLLSWVISSVPAAVTLVGLVRGMAAFGVPAGPLWWALALGVGLGASGSPLGSASNLVAQAIAERNKSRLTSGMWVREALPITLFGSALASFFLWLGIVTGWFL